MFKAVRYSEEAVSTSSDSETEPCEEGNGNIESVTERHVHIDAYAVQKEFGTGLPTFNCRPLSDTPIVSRLASPSVSIDSSTETNFMVCSNHSCSGVNCGCQKYVEDNSIKVSEHERLPPDAKSNKQRATTIDVPGLTRSKTSPDGIISKEDLGSKLVIVMVGLPATGKSFITNKLSRFLNYSFYYCKVFNVGNTRREYAKMHDTVDQDSKFFDFENLEASALRDKWAMDTLDELLVYLLDGPGSVAIFDATNSTKKRRNMICERIRARNSQLNVLFLESICSNKATVERNIRLKLLGPDYKGNDPVASLRDFKDRLANYFKAYESVEDSENVQYIKMVDVGKKVISYNIKGFLASQTVYYLLNFNLAERQIWITRNGESESNIVGRIGGDSKLTERGQKYSKALSRFIDEERAKVNEQEYMQYLKHNENNEEFVPSSFFVWTSMLSRSIETAAYFNEDVYPIKQMRMLDELSAGECEGLTYEEIHDKYPAEFEERLKDKLRYRYPGIGGESYMDVINRLRPVITEVERITDNVLIITHRVVARVLLGYFLNLNRDIIANLDVPLHSVYCLEPKPYGINWSFYKYNEEEDRFIMVPHTQLNTTIVKELGLVHNERRYSIVPTTPLSAPADDTSRRATADTASLAKSLPSSSLSCEGGIGAVNTKTTVPIRQQPAYLKHSSLLACPRPENALKSGKSSTVCSNNGHGLELNKLNEKLSLFQDHSGDKIKESHDKSLNEHNYEEVNDNGVSNDP